MTHDENPHAQKPTKEPAQMCWIPNCERRAIFRDWSGWRWCWRHVLSHAARPLRWRFFPPATPPKELPNKAKNSFWLDGGYDFELVAACPYHPEHKWLTFRLGDVVEHGYNLDQLMTICAACYVPRCGSTADADRCTLWRHHRTAHVLESGRKEPMGTALTGAA